jgi:hypothetical protein
MEWFLIKMLFVKSGLKKSLKKLNKDQIIEYKKKAIDEENYELAALLQYYAEYKK